jgi:hypothetical protein
MSDLLYVGLTILIFAVLTLLIKGVERVEASKGVDRVER